MKKPKKLTTRQLLFKALIFAERDQEQLAIEEDGEIAEEAAELVRQFKAYRHKRGLYAEGEERPRVINISLPVTKEAFEHAKKGLK